MKYGIFTLIYIYIREKLLQTDASILLISMDVWLDVE